MLTKLFPKLDKTTLIDTLLSCNGNTVSAIHKLLPLQKEENPEEKIAPSTKAACNLNDCKVETGLTSPLRYNHQRYMAAAAAAAAAASVATTQYSGFQGTFLTLYIYFESFWLIFFSTSASIFEIHFD